MQNGTYRKLFYLFHRAFPCLRLSRTETAPEVAPLCFVAAPLVHPKYTLVASRFRRNLLKVNFGARGATTFQCNPCEDEILLFAPKTGKFFVV